MFRRILHWLKLGLLFMLALLVLAAMIGAAYQARSNARDAKLYHPEGKLVDIGSGRHIHLICAGSGSPTVLLESGLGSPAIHWRTVIHGVKPFTRVCAYDRAGYGYSDPGPMPRTTNLIVDDLDKLLTTAGEHGPYLPVGHSFGGFNIRVFAARHRSDLAGLIFVDSSHPEQSRRMSLPVTAGIVMNFLPLLNRLGVVRAVGVYSGTEPELGYLISQPKYIDAIRSEMNAFEESAQQVTSAGSFADLPITALTAGKDGMGNPRAYDVWRNQLQPELAHLSTRGRQVVVEDSTHMIPLEKPQAIIDAIRQMVGATQDRAGASNR